MIQIKHTHNKSFFVSTHDTGILYQRIMGEHPHFCVDDNINKMVDVRVLQVVFYNEKSCVIELVRVEDYDNDDFITDK